MSGWSGRPTNRRAGWARSVPAILLVAGGLAASNATGNGVAHAAWTSPLGWTAPATIPAAQTLTSPALAEYNGLLYAAWSGQGTLGMAAGVWYSAYNGSTWSTQAKVPGVLTHVDGGVALGVYAGALYFVWQGSSNYAQLWYSAFNGTTWTTQAKVPSALTSEYPYLAAYNGRLYLAWDGTSSPHRIWYSAFNGTSWSKEARIPSVTNVNGSALAAYGSKLYVTWANPSHVIEYDSFNGATWSGPKSLTSNAFDQATLAVVAGELYDGWTDGSGGGYGDVTYSAFNGTTWSADGSVPSSLGCNGPPILAAYNTSLFVAWESSDCGDSGPIDYSSGP
jgi:hypothetical protein